MLSLVSCGGVTRPSGNRGLARVPLPDLAGSLLPEPPAPGRSRPRPPSLGRCLQGCGPPGSPLPHALCGNPSFMEGTRDAPVMFALLFSCTVDAAVSQTFVVTVGF